MKYVALLRGIMPTNPNMRGEKLKAVFEGIGLTNVHTVIASGNVIFDSPMRSASALEKKIETMLPEQLGFKSTTIIRSRQEIEALVQSDPFKDIRDEKPNYLIVTFFKNRHKELCTVVDLRKGKTPEFMAALEKKYGKELTTRTWRTVSRILNKMDETNS